MNSLIRFGFLTAVFSFASVAAHAQFRELKPAPFAPTVARQKIRTLLENVNADNRDQTVATISDWLKWYRDIADDELIARWKSPDRANLTLVMAPLADARVAREVVDFSWRVDRSGTFTLANAPLLGDLMARYQESAKPFLDDLLMSPPPALPQSAAEAACRILLDAPDIDAWRKSALQILPRYRPVADQLLKQDMAGPDQEKVYRAIRWRADLKLDPPAVSSRKLQTRPIPATATIRTTPDTYSQRPHITGPQASPTAGYTGPMSGTFESTGDPIPQNGEYVFPNIPPVKLMLDFDTKHWEARLAPGEGNTQVLVLRNKGKGPQKKCVVHWTVTL